MSRQRSLVGSHASTSPPRAGRTLEQIQEEVTLDDVRRSCPAWTPASLDEDWRETVKSLVERSFRGVRGQD